MIFYSGSKTYKKINAYINSLEYRSIGVLEYWNIGIVEYCRVSITPILQ